MKKFLVILLVIALMLTGCGKSQPAEEVPAGTIEQHETEPVLEEKPVSMGRLEGGTYINEYAGFACDLDSSWTFMGAEELQDIPENTRKLFEGSELAEEVDTLSQFTDMLAENVDQMATINVLYQKHSMQERLAYAVLDESEILDSLLEMQDKLIEAYNQAGFEVDAMEKVTVSFLGETRVALRTSMHLEDIPYYTLQLFDYDLGRYSVTLTLASFVEDNTESLMELFYKVG